MIIPIIGILYDQECAEKSNGFLTHIKHNDYPDSWNCVWPRVCGKK